MVSAAALALVLGVMALALAVHAYAFDSDLSARVAPPLAGAAWVLALVAVARRMR